MEVVVVANAVEAGRLLSGQIVRGVRAGTLQVLGVATGSSPLSTYAALRAANPPGLRDLTVFALDEYVGLPAEHPESYRSVIDREVTRPLGLDPDRVHVPDGRADDLPAACRAYEDAIRAAGGIDLQILGIGATGHIGFNEPTSSFSSRTRVKTLTAQTRRDNARYFASQDDVPHHCVTQGLGTIMEARKVVLVAFGESKAKAVAAAVEGPVTSMCPASVLQIHPDATMVVDEPAASQLRLRHYYDYVWENRPAWQRDEQDGP
jgi:glucosamine-6-phosphate deaminase